jgi:hypothetical protein
MVSEHQSALSQPYVSVRKYYSAPPCSIPAHLPLDVPEQCCGLSLSTLTLRGSTDGHPPDNRRSTSQSIANSPISIACSAPPTRFWPASSASPVARSRTGSTPSPAPRWKSGQKDQKPLVQLRWHCLHGLSVAAVRKGLLPVTVISDPGNGTQKFLLLRAGPTGRERCDESRRLARD